MYNDLLLQNSLEQTKDIFTSQEVAEYLRISDSELRILMSEQQINFFEVGRTGSKNKVKRFRKSDIEHFIKKNLIKKG